MKTRYIQIAFLTVLLGGGLAACTNGDEFFKDERYKKMIYAISDNDQIFNAEFELTNEEEVVGVQPFAVSGTNPIDQDVHLTVEKDPELLTEYNYSHFMDETDKYALALDEGAYSLPTTSVEIKAGVNPSYEVGKLQVKIKTSVLEQLSLDQTYFLTFRIKEGSPYEINEEKRNVLFRVMKKNKYASQKNATYYMSSGYMDESPMATDSKIIMPLAYNKVRAYVAGKIYNASDTQETISKCAMVITVDADNQISMSVFDAAGTLKVETLTPSDDPNDGSYGYRNYYNPETKQFFLYYRYDAGEGWKVVREILKAESTLGE